jgi:hypothetical protein
MLTTSVLASDVLCIRVDKQLKTKAAQTLFTYDNLSLEIGKYLIILLIRSLTLSILTFMLHIYTS